MNALPGLGHFPANDIATARFREAGDLTLDLTHRDGRVEDRWLGLDPREFAILWRLAARPGEPVSDAELIADLWRARQGTEAADLARLIVRLRAKLAAFGLADLVAAGRGGGHALAARPSLGLAPGSEPRGH